jgi:HPt (histidine-containing phosphotransfer) domain-containing protein
VIKTAATAAVPASAASPGSADAAIDVEHLTRMTLGDAGLQAEVLRLFERQATMLVGRMAGAPPKVVAALAHTLKGSARGVGATHVAVAAESLERAAAAAGAADLDRALAEMGAAVAEARLAIGALLPCE